MLWLKGCPRCGGDMASEKDIYGSYISCLACGFYLSDAEEVVFRYKARKAKIAQLEKDRGETEQAVASAA